MHARLDNARSILSNEPLSRNAAVERTGTKDDGSCIFFTSYIPVSRMHVPDIKHLHGSSCTNLVSMHLPGEMVFICETERVLIRPLSLNDLSSVTEILGDPEVMKHSVRGVCDEAAARKFIEWCLSCYKSHGVGPWALVEKESLDLIGFCGVGPERVGDTEEINLGYRLARRFWGAGLATESACAALAYAFEVKAFRSVVVMIEPEHVASMRVAEKAGFCGFQNVQFHGREVRLYRMRCDEWTSSRKAAHPPK